MSFRMSYLFIMLVLVISCQTYTVKDDYIDKSFNEHYFKKHFEDDEALLFFTYYYKDYNVKIIQDNKVLFDSVIATNDDINSIKFGLAAGFKVKSTRNVTIRFESIKKELVIDKKDLDKAKTIYLSKDNKKIIVALSHKEGKFIAASKDDICNIIITKIDSSAYYYLLSFKQSGLLRNKKEKLLIINKDEDTVINNLQKAKVGDRYKVKFNDGFYNEIMHGQRINNENAFYHDDVLIWSIETDRKFYTTDDFINLFYIDKKT